MHQFCTVRVVKNLWYVTDWHLNKCNKKLLCEPSLNGDVVLWSSEELTFISVIHLKCHKIFQSLCLFQTQSSSSGRLNASFLHVCSLIAEGLMQIWILGVHWKWIQQLPGRFVFKILLQQRSLRLLPLLRALQAEAARRPGLRWPWPVQRPIRRIEDRQGCVQSFPWLMGPQRGRIPGYDGGGQVSLGAVKLPPDCSSPPAHFTEQILDFLHHFEDHRLSEENVDPGV